jgi:hypothetical protein
MLQNEIDSMTKTMMTSTTESIPMPGLNPEDIARREGDISENSNSIVYSKRYSDDHFEYR